MASFTERLVGAAKLDANTFEEVEMDRSAMNQAMAVVVLANVAAGVGSSRNGLIAGIIAALVGWFIWARLTYFHRNAAASDTADASRLGSATPYHWLFRVSRNLAHSGSYPNSGFPHLCSCKCLDAGCIYRGSSPGA
jgi:hypothetical protein